jgi:hypothetical protein
MEPTKEQTMMFQQLSMWSEPLPNEEKSDFSTPPDQVWWMLSQAQQQFLKRTLVTICHHLVKAETRPSQKEVESDEAAS